MATRILWVDDEIDMLRAHCIYLENRGYEVATETNAADALQTLRNERFDLIFLDENMSGMSGLDAIFPIKELHPDTPVVMVTKSEEESIMEQAIGSKIADYIIKPVNPSQLLLCLKKNLDGYKLINKTTQTQYQSQFQSIAAETMQCSTFDDWAALYHKLVRWELDLQGIRLFDDVQLMQKNEANIGFARFVKKNYLEWIKNPDTAPLLSHKVLSRRVMPLIDQGQKVALIVIDNCRLDQWEVIRQLLTTDFDIDTELYCSILPTATQYARNAIFSGLMPLQIKQLYPDYWVDTDEESSQNKYENQLLGTFFERYRRRDVSYGYYKVNDAESGNRFLNIFNRYQQNNLNAIVFNFVDMLSHARTDSKMVKELTTDMAAYRSLTRSWFQHSPLHKLISLLRNKGIKILITTDHGSIRVSKPTEIVGDRETNSNLRFKTGKQLKFNSKDVFEIRTPEDAMLPRNNLTSSFVFTTGEDFFVYQNNYNRFCELFNGTFQHGGISMEEMIIPLATLTAKK